MTATFQAVGIPTSLVSPEAASAADRRYIKNQKTNGSAPTVVTNGVRTHGCEQLIVVIQLPDAGTSLDYTVYVWDHVAEVWCIAQAATSVAVAASPARAVVPIYGAMKVAVLLNNFSGTFTTGANVWLSDNGRMDNGTGSE